MALRLSGQLLLGVAFRPGVVDLTEDQLNVNTTTITLQANTIDVNLVLPDDNWDMGFIDRPLRDSGHHQAQIEDITLPLTNGLDHFGTFDNFDIGPSDGIGSQDFQDIDLGIDWDGAPARENEDGMSVDHESIGVGRDAASVHSMRSFHLNGISKGIDLDMQSIRSLSRDPSEPPFQSQMDMDFPDFGGMDLELPDTPAADDNPLPDTNVEPKPVRKPRERKQIIDSVTEMADGPGFASQGDGPFKDVSNIVTEQRFLPRTALEMKLFAIGDDPLPHFLPTKTINNDLFLSAGPPGLAPELAELFLRPLESSGQKRRYASVAPDGSKRIRLDEDEVEAGRRGVSLAPSIAGLTDKGGEDHNLTGDFDFGDQTGGLDEYQLDLPNEDGYGNVDFELGRSRSVSVAPSVRSRLSTPGAEGWEGEGGYIDSSCPIAMFDRRQPPTQAQEEAQEADAKGFSKNTVKALGFVRKELQPTDDVEDVTMSFNAMATKATRRAAASFFFELLVLGTRDCVKLTQPAPFEDIRVQGKPRLWQAQRHSPRSSE
ncbi:Rad21 protein [Coprinopsis cinerea okayama7|uniref:Rad21 protein n=1 Tax=Coprinopsis cinerea (strain Okayama-7 / 130 / ATCC MYA-4618 / FGSC 9003) TaxID=240176 RepID=A8NFY2_COPC7|nr:Rad21 protein [Coprinopsis cinerea okayama7\|eukprot:XP_001833427.2 Rad21 protein [Coprinopsis cinerea okayama7\